MTPKEWQKCSLRWRRSRNLEAIVLDQLFKTEISPQGRVQGKPACCLWKCSDMWGHSHFRFHPPCLFFPTQSSFGFPFPFNLSHTHSAAWDYFSPNVIAEWEECSQCHSMLLLQTSLCVPFTLSSTVDCCQQPEKATATKCRKLHSFQNLIPLLGYGIWAIFSDSFPGGTVEAAWNIPVLLRVTQPTKSLGWLLPSLWGQVSPFLFYVMKHESREIF